MAVRNNGELFYSNLSFDEQTEEAGFVDGEVVCNTQPSVSSSRKTRTGLKNIGNSCYMNSVIQCLATLPLLTRYFKSDIFKTEIQLVKDVGHRNIISTLATSMKAMSFGTDVIIDLTALKAAFGIKHPAFKGNTQQDAHEWLTKLLDSFYSQFCPDSSASKISQLFGGKTKSCTKCPACRSETVSVEPFLILSIPIPTISNPRKGNVDIQDCLDLYTAEQVVDDWTCASCQTKGSCIKTTEILNLPHYLIIHLKRFDNSLKKIGTEVTFPTDRILDLSSLVGNDDASFSESQFQLRGISNHYGTNLNGHYTAYCRDISNKWWSCDDEQLSILLKDANSRAAYILFYENVKKNQFLTTVQLNTPAQPDTGAFICKIFRCGLKFTSQVQLVVHMNDAHHLPRVSLLKENQANELVTAVEMEILHKDMITEGPGVMKVEIVDVLEFPSDKSATVKARVCPECGKSFAYKKGLTRHIKAVHEKIRHPCPKCTKSFKDSYGLKKHIKSVHEGREERNQSNELATAGRMETKDKDMVTEGPNVMVEIVDVLEFPSDESATVKAHVCPDCGKSFAYKFGLTRHIKAVHEKIRHSCPKCSKSFINNYGLKKHLKFVHEGKPESYLCKKCEQSFEALRTLQQHIKFVHEGIKFVCQKCDKPFTNSTNLLRHIKSLHDGIRYSCPICKKPFADSKTMIRHLQSVHVEMRYQCLKCEEFFGNDPSLQKHIQIAHAEMRSDSPQAAENPIEDTKKPGNEIQIKDLSTENNNSPTLQPVPTNSIWSKLMEICFS